MARKKFKAKSVSAGSGLVAASHGVTLTDGSSITVRSKGVRPVKGERVRQVARAKKAVINRLPQQEARFREIMRRAIREFESELKRSDNPAKRRLDGKLRASEVKRLEKKLTRIVSNSTKAMRDTLVSNVESSVKTYLLGLNQASPDKIGTLKEISADAKSTARAIYRQRVGGATAAERLAVIAGRLDSELRSMIGSTKAERPAYKEKAIARLVTPKHEGKACASRGLARLNRTEQSRAIHMATVSRLKSVGVGLAYWRLSPFHKDYGGSEVCEVLATSTGPDVNAELNKLGSSISTVGLYTLDKFPTVPHANCMCSIDPVF